MTAPNKKTVVEAATSTTANESSRKHSPNQPTKHLVLAERPDGTVEALCGHTWPKGSGVDRSARINNYPTCTACDEIKAYDNEFAYFELTARALDYLAGLYRE